LAPTTTILRPPPRSEILNRSLEDRFAVLSLLAAPVDAMAQRPADFVDMLAAPVDSFSAQWRPVDVVDVAAVVVVVKRAGALLSELVEGAFVSR
jgi:hypothetical protein